MHNTYLVRRWLDLSGIDLSIVTFQPWKRPLYTLPEADARARLEAANLIKVHIYILARMREMAPRAIFFM